MSQNQPNPAIKPPDLNNETELKRFVFDLINAQYKRKKIAPMTYPIFNQTWKNLKSTADGREWIKNIVKTARPAKLLASKEKRGVHRAKKMSAEDKKWANYLSKRLQLPFIRAMHIVKFINQQGIDIQIVDWDKFEGGDLNVEAILKRLYSRPHADVSDVDDLERELMEQQEEMIHQQEYAQTQQTYDLTGSFDYDEYRNNPIGTYSGFQKLPDKIAEPKSRAISRYRRAWATKYGEFIISLSKNKRRNFIIGMMNGKNSVIGELVWSKRDHNFRIIKYPKYKYSAKNPRANRKRTKIQPGQFALESGAFQSHKLSEFGDIGKAKGRGRLKGFALKDKPAPVDDRTEGKGEQVDIFGKRVTKQPEIQDQGIKSISLESFENPYGKQKPLAVVFDWDDTIVYKSSKNLRKGIDKVIRDFAKTHTIIYLTGNMDLSKAMVKQYRLPAGLIYKRKHKGESIARMKKQKLEALKEKFDITAFFDDDWTNIQVAKALSIPTVHMEYRSNGWYKPKLQKAIDKYERFNHKAPTEIVEYDYEPPTKSNIIKMGEIVRVDYISDKKLENPKGEIIYYHHTIEHAHPILAMNKNNNNFLYSLGSQEGRPEGLVSNRSDKKYKGKIPNINDETAYFEIGQLARIDYRDPDDNKIYTLTFDDYKLIEDDTATFMLFVPV